MGVSTASFPDKESLERALTEISGKPVSVLERSPNWWRSTYPSEVVVCRSEVLGDHPILCKYEVAGAIRAAYGHRRGPGYEALVYGRLLRQLDLPSPAFHGAYTPPGGNETWLFIAYLGEGAGVDEADSPESAMELAAAWLGAFHAAGERWLSESGSSFLAVYDPDYYTQWIRRTADFAGAWHDRLPWLAPLCKAAESCVAAFFDDLPVVIHGEFTPSNVLIRDGRIQPVDWESAAVAMGEIDLVSLIEKWPSPVAERCRTAYEKARWPAGTPEAFARRTALSWLYWHFRWLGERKDWLEQSGTADRFDHLREVGKSLGLVR